jgi:hypothetical protein
MKQKLLILSVAILGLFLQACAVNPKPKPKPATSQIGVDLEALAMELKTMRSAASRQAESAKRIENTANEILQTLESNQ